MSEQSSDDVRLSERLQSAVLSSEQTLSLASEDIGSPDETNAEAIKFLRDRGLPLTEVVLAFFDQSDDCIKLVDPEGYLLFMNCNGRQAMEVDDFQVVAGQQWQSLWPPESQHLVAAAVDQARAGNVSRFEAFCPTAKGSPAWWDVTVTPIRDRLGNVAAILASSRDITDRKVKEEALASIAAEMKHRLRNAYTVCAAISVAMAKGQLEHAGFARELAERMMGLAEVQAKLVDVGEARLADVIAGVVRSFGQADAVHVGSIPDLRLNDDTAKALTLVLGELSTNSLKYGALSGRGRVEVRADENGDSIELEWRETHDTEASALTFSQVGGGSGRRLMDRMLASVGGTFHGAPTGDGYRALIRFRVPERA